jgi:ribonucrease Y
MGALLHDIGKAVSHEVEGAHAQVGADIAKRYGVPAEVVNIIASHHHEVDQLSAEAAIATAADAISGSRPGARREALETYVKRIQALEEIGNSFKGVQQTYAIQAGREVRVIVKPEDVDDLASIRLAKDIAKRIEDNRLGVSGSDQGDGGPRDAGRHAKRRSSASLPTPKVSHTTFCTAITGSPG